MLAHGIKNCSRHFLRRFERLREEWTRIRYRLDEVTIQCFEHTFIELTTKDQLERRHSTGRQFVQEVVLHVLLPDWANDFSNLSSSSWLKQKESRSASI